MGAVSQREVRAVGLGFSLLLAYIGLVLASGLVELREFTRLAALYLSVTSGIWILAGFLAIVWLLVTHGLKPGGDPSPINLLTRVIGARWHRDRLLSLFWPPLLFALLMASFNAFKQFVLPHAGFAYDAAFAGVDRALFLGDDAWVFSHRILPSPWISLLLDRAYHAWFLPVTLGVVLCAFLPASSWRLRTQYLLSYMAIWILLGSFIAFALPAAGPCFYSELIQPAPNFDGLLAKLNADQAIVTQSNPDGKFFALFHQAKLLDAMGAKTLIVGGGISAMPSVHNALAVLFALVSSRVHWLAGALMWAYAAIIWVGSIHLGWHYAIDGVVAAGLTLAIWRATGRIANWLERPAPPVAATAPAPAL